MSKKVQSAGGKNTKTRRPAPQKEEYSLLKDERVRFIAGIFITGFAVYLVFAFIAFLVWWKADQSFDPSKVISSPDITVRNWSGKSGAWFADGGCRGGHCGTCDTTRGRMKKKKTKKSPVKTIMNKG